MNAIYLTGQQSNSVPKTRRVLTPVEWKKLHEKLPWAFSATSLYSYAAIWMLLLTGCRVPELLALSWEDVDLEKGCFYLKARSGGQRVVPLSNKAKQLLVSLPRPDDSLAIFWGHSYPKTNYRDIRNTWQYLCIIADIPRIQLRDLRRSFADFALTQGVSIAVVAQILGERRKLGIQPFAPLELAHLREAANKVAQAFE